MKQLQSLSLTTIVLARIVFDSRDFRKISLHIFKSNEKPERFTIKKLKYYIFQKLRLFCAYSNSTLVSLTSYFYYISIILYVNFLNHSNFYKKTSIVIIDNLSEVVLLEILNIF